MSTLWQLWMKWWSGNLPPDTILWGMKLIWWGRIGKFAQFIGGATIIADIIGPARIRAFGKSMHFVVSSETLISLIKRLFGLWRVQFENFRLYAFLYAKGKMPIITGKFGVIAITYESWLKLRGKVIDVEWANKRFYETLDELKENPLYNRIQYGLPILMIIFNIVMFSKAEVWGHKTILGKGFAALMVFSLATAGALMFSMYLSSVIFFLLLLPGLLIDFVLIEPFAWMLERESLERIIKIIALLLLLAGFHFDFLAS